MSFDRTARPRKGAGLAQSSFKVSRGGFVELLEPRELLSGTTSQGTPILAPAHVVIVIEEDRAANAIGDIANMPYFNQLANTGLVYGNSFGLNTASQQGEMNYLALYSGSTQGVTNDGSNYKFSGTDLADLLTAKGLSFAGYAENLPSDGSQVQVASGTSHGTSVPDLYTRDYNPMAMFDNTGKTNATYNKTFAEFPTTASGYAALPAVSFVIPNNFDNTHGSNETYPWAGTSDPTINNTLKQWADTWLKTNLDGYLQWAKQNNSLLIVTGDEGDRANGFTSLATNKVTTIVNGDSRLFSPGVNSTGINAYSILRTLEDMYGLKPLGNSAGASDLPTDATGKLTPTSSGPAKTASTIALTSAANPSTFGQGVTFTATVTGAGATPGGSVTFEDGTRILGAGTLAQGKATFVVSGLTGGTHSITAVYAGDSNFAGSTSSALSQVVSPAGTATTLSASPNPAVAGQTVTFSVNVSDSAGVTPTGTVLLTDAGAVLANGGLNSSGAVTFTIPNLSAGSHTIVATYSGSTNLATSASATLTEVINPATTGPAADNFANATVLAGSPLAVAASNVGATKEAGEPNHGGNAGGASVWWTWTAPSSGTVTVDTHGSNFDTTMGVYTGTSVSALTTIASDDDDWANNTNTSKVTFTAVAGVAYKIAVDGYNGATGNISLHLALAAAAPNDNFANATVLTGTSLSVTGSNVGATKEAGEPNHGGNAGGASVWWTWTAPSSGTVTIDTHGSNFDTTMGVYTGTSVSTLTTIASDDDDWANNTNTSKVTFTAVAGTTYRIAVDGYNGLTGNILLNLTLA